MIPLNLKKDLSVTREIREVDLETGNQGIAIIGLALRMPAAGNKEQFWKNLLAGKDCITSFPESRRRDTDAYLKYTDPHAARDYKEAAYLADIDGFDYRLFNISPREASLMDPHQRLFLETAWEAIEDAGYGGRRIRSSQTGVYLGFVPRLGYHQYIMELEPDCGFLAIPGNISSITASRISYILDLAGPAVVIDTACSSSLVAVHMACQGILAGDCDMALAGGVKIILLPVETNIKFDIESVSGRTRAFDEQADGTAFGEGAGVLLLKPLAAALRDFDHIYAVIKSSAVNQDGSATGITAPNANAQAQVIRKAWKRAGINPESLAFIEAHGTGTKLGDPIEIDGLTKAFSLYTTRKKFCAIGSVKTNLGHLDSAAGITGLIKALLALQHKKLPPSLHFETPNSQINFAESPVFVNTGVLDLESAAAPLRCGVSAFGLGGTNCHVVLEAAPRPETEPVPAGPAVFTLSARSETALQGSLQNYIAFFKGNTQLDFHNICYTVCTGREHFECRIAVMAADLADLIIKLEHLVDPAPEAADIKGIFRGNHQIVSKKGTGSGYREILPAEHDTLTRKAAEISARFREEGDSKWLSKLCSLYAEGAGIDWNEFYPAGSGKKVSLPAYHFEKKRCWLEVPGNADLFDKVAGQFRDYYTNAKSGFSPPAIYPPELEEYVILQLVRVFRELGVIGSQVGTGGVQDVLNRCGIKPEKKRFFLALCGILERKGFLELQGERICIYPKAIAPGTMEKIEHTQQHRAHLLQQSGHLAHYLEVLERCLGNYQALLRGQENGTNILFPGSSTTLIEKIYKDDQNSDSCNMLAADTVNIILKIYAEHHQNRKIRILEVGAGVGGTTGWVLDRLGHSGDLLEYYYTDISPALLLYGKSQFAASRPFLHFKRLDLEQDFSGADFTAEGFDIVLAANVLHTTKNIHHTLTRLQSVMKADTFLILIEGIRAIDFSTMVLGVLDGWWKYEDEELRIPGTPLLGVSAWEKALGACGFTRCLAAGEDSWNQRMILAWTPGKAHQRRPAAAEPAARPGQTTGLKTSRTVLRGRQQDNYTEHERNVARIWSELLALDEISIFADYNSLGGDSIIATRILNNINNTFHTEITYADLMTHATVEEFARFLENPTGETEGEHNVYSTIQAAPAPVTGEFFTVPVSSAQKRVFALGQLPGVGTTYNIPGRIRIDGPLDRARVASCFQALVARHEALRTSFEFADGELVQKIRLQHDFHLEYTEAASGEVDALFEQFIKPFSLNEPPLLRVLLIRESTDRHTLCIDIHHIISDAVSMDIMIEEFIKLYAGEQLPPLALQYRDYTSWQQQLFETGMIREQGKFWLNMFAGEIPVLNLPLDFPRPQQQSFAGAAVSVRLDDAMADGLKRLTWESGTTLFMLLLAAYTILLAKYTAQDDILVGTMVAGRRNKDLEKVIGMFVNTLVIRNRPAAGQSFSEFLQTVKENCLAVYENQDYPFERLVEKLNIGRDPGKNPLFDTALSVQNITDQRELSTQNLKFRSLQPEVKTVFFALVMNAFQKPGGIFFELHYGTALFTAQTARRILGDYIKLLTMITADFHILIKDIKLAADYTLLEKTSLEDVSFNL